MTKSELVANLTTLNPLIPSNLIEEGANEILEKMNENNRNNIVVTTANKDSQLSKDLIEIVQSKEFDEIIDKEFKGFDKPEK